MYYPYLRGKQYELITLKERATLIRENKIVPIIEPVKSNLSSLVRTVNELQKQQARFVIVVNPKCGDLKNNPLPLFTELIDKLLKDYEHHLLGYIVNADSNLIDVKDFVDEYKHHRVALVHNGFPKGKDLQEEIAGSTNVKKHIFVEKFSGKLYQKNFNTEGVDRIFLRDGFTIRKNADHPDKEHFSDLHVTYTDEGMDGFGDFLTVGDDYTETGGPAYAVAIHLTYIEEEDMFIRHFKSDRTNTPVDPAGKFFEALEKLQLELNGEKTSIFKSSACEEFLELYKKGHFPGLGYVKKLSMIHHLELIADVLKGQ